jgi:hypothetical protein
MPKSRQRRKGKDRPQLRPPAVVPDPLVIVQIDGQLLIFPARHYPEASRCIARTTAGDRCRNPIDYGQPTCWYEWPVAGGVVSGFDLDRDDELFLRHTPDAATLRRRWLEQRCGIHYGTSAVNSTEPEWRIFDPARDSAAIHKTRLRGRAAAHD